MSKISKLILSILFLSACSSVESIKESVDDLVPLDLSEKEKAVFGNKDYADALVSKVVPKWFEVDDRFKLTSSMGEKPAHLFYDVQPDLNAENYKLNFVITTPEGSDKLYNIDMLSGQHYVDKILCEQKDIFGKWDDSIYKPPFTSGIVPRMLDQLGTPQKIIVFGDGEYFSKHYQDNFFDARVIGGYIEKVCQIGTCPKLTDYNSRIVVVAVQSGSDDYKEVRGIEDLRTKVNWPEVKAFIENGFGKNYVAGKFYPSYRMGPELSALQTVSSLKSRSILLTNKRLNQIRSSCYKLYDYVWEAVAKPSDVEKKLAAAKSLKERRDIIRGSNKESRRFFYERFKNAFVKFGDEYNVCSKFVYPTNIFTNPERHWFMAHYAAVHLLNDLGYSFDCNRSLWVKNPILTDGTKAIKRNKEFAKCNARQVDLAFEQSINYLNNLRFKNYPTYRYIDYDRGSIGTHNKLYSWVYQENKKLQCYGKQEDLVEKVPTFPEDIKWRRRATILRTK